MGTFLKINTPRMMVKMEITIATIGLLIKNSLIKSYWKLFSALLLILGSGIIIPVYNGWFDYRIRIYKRTAQDSHFFPLFQPFSYNPVTTHACTHLYNGW